MKIIATTRNLMRTLACILIAEAEAGVSTGYTVTQVTNPTA